MVISCLLIAVSCLTSSRISVVRSSDWRQWLETVMLVLCIVLRIVEKRLLLYGHSLYFMMTRLLEKKIGLTKFKGWACSRLPYQLYRIYPLICA